jgi:thiol-disulfide isomerase/thioredoxin
MIYLVSAIGALCLLNLSLALAVIRRLRQHDEQLARRPGADARVTLLPAGTEVPEFTVTTLSGQPRSLSDLIGSRSLIAFLSPTCPPCRAQVPDLRAYASDLPGGAAQVLVIVSGIGDRAAELTAELDGVASIAVEPPMGTAQHAFSVSGYPSFFTLDERGRVEASGMSVRRLPATGRLTGMA